MSAKVIPCSVRGGGQMFYTFTQLDLWVDDV